MIDWQMGRWQQAPRPLGLLLAAILVGIVGRCDGGISSAYVRKAEKTIDMPLDSDVFRVPPGYNAPQQVHITQGDLDGTAMIISWVTEDEPGSSEVLYGTDENNLDLSAEGIYTRYKFYNYTSGYIHHCTINNLKHDTKYYYAIGIGDAIRKFWFISPPEVGSDVPYTFGLIGDLGQSYDSNITLAHYESNPNAQAVLFLGDLSYADKYPYHDNVRWDTWGRFVERNAAYQPWIWTAGNHEIDYAPELGETIQFKPYTHRYWTPFESSGSTEPYWYSIKMASAHIIVVASYSAYVYRSSGAQEVEQKTQLARSMAREGSRRAQCIRGTKELRKSTPVDEKNVRDVRGTRSRSGSLLEEKAVNWVQVSPIPDRRNHPSEQSRSGRPGPRRAKPKQRPRIEKVNVVDFKGSGTRKGVLSRSRLTTIRCEGDKIYPLQAPGTFPSTPIKAINTALVQKLNRTSNLSSNICALHFVSLTSSLCAFTAVRGFSA